MSRIPAENVERAVHLLDLARRAAADPAVIAATDQIEAFRRDVDPIMDTVARIDRAASHLTVTPTPLTMAWELAVIEAVTYRSRTLCQHAAGSLPLHLNQRRFINLSLGVLVCEGCFAAAVDHARALLGPDTDDGVCDVCDRPSVEFAEFGVTLSLWFVTGNQCADCVAAMMDGRSE